MSCDDVLPLSQYTDIYTRVECARGEKGTRRRKSIGKPNDDDGATLGWQLFSVLVQ